MANPCALALRYFVSQTKITHFSCHIVNYSHVLQVLCRLYLMRETPVLYKFLVLVRNPFCFIVTTCIIRAMQKEECTWYSSVVPPSHKMWWIHRKQYSTIFMSSMDIILLPHLPTLDGELKELLQRHASEGN